MAFNRIILADLNVDKHRPMVNMIRIVITLFSTFLSHIYQITFHELTNITMGF